MSWQIRHEGSPTATGGLTPNQIIEGLNEGIWDMADEVRGPGETKWTPLESHPHFEEALADYDPEPVKHVELEEHLQGGADGGVVVDHQDLGHGPSL